MLDEFFAASIQELHVEVAFDFEFLTSTTVLSSWNSLAVLSIFLYGEGIGVYSVACLWAQDITRKILWIIYTIF